MPDTIAPRLDSVGQRVQFVRLMADLTQAQMARLIGMASPALQRIEWHRASCETLAARTPGIADALR